MKILEAIQYLKDNGFICESSNFTHSEGKRYGRQIGLNHKSNVLSGRYNVKFDDSLLYNDREGKRWLLIKNRDEETIYRAMLDGMIDVYKAEIDKNDENEVNTLKKVTQLYKQATTIDDIKNIIKEYFSIKLANAIYRFLKRYMQGETTVYRGFNFNRDDYIKLTSGHAIKFRKDLLPLIDNKSKRFNSFSVSYDVAASFTDHDPRAITIAAEVEPNDVNWAFTAYLMGRHRSTSEYELNINNLKNLKNLRIVINPEVEYKRNKYSLPSIKYLQGQIDNGTPLEELFDNVTKDDDYIKCYRSGFELLVKNGHIITEFVTYINPIDDDIGLTYDGFNYQLYRFGHGTYGKKYNYIYTTERFSDELRIAAVTKKRFQLINYKTAEEVLPEPAIGIEKVKNLGHNKTSVFATYGLIQVIYPNYKTIINPDGKDLIPDSNNITNIKYIDPDGIIEVTYKNYITKKYQFMRGKFISLY